jgi:ubiquinone/menaquinone biosynthesis C-methylase UbiE
MIGDSCWWIDYLLYKLFRRFFQNPYHVLKDLVAPGMKALDVGCGKGYFSLGMARMVGQQGRVIAVDLRADDLALLRKKAARARLAERIDTRVCRDDDLAVGDLGGQIDFALAVYVVHHATDAAQLMGEVQHALRPGGKFLVIEPRHHATVAECQAVEEAARHAGFTIHAHPRLKRDWAVLLVKS